MRALIAEILRERDLTKTSLKQVWGELESRLSMALGALNGCRREIKRLTDEVIERIQEARFGACSSVPTR